MAVGAATASGGDSGAQAFAGESKREEGKEREIVREVRGGAWHLQRDARGSKEAGGGARQAFARRARALAYWHEEEGDREALVGWAVQLGRQLGCNMCSKLGQVGFSLSLCFLSFIYSVCLIWFNYQITL